MEWQTKEDFEKKEKSRRCWITCKGKVEIAYYDHSRPKIKYFYLTTGQPIPFPECIAFVQPIIKPELPKAKPLLGLTKMSLGWPEIKEGFLGIDFIGLILVLLVVGTMFGAIVCVLILIVRLFG